MARYAVFLVFGAISLMLMVGCQSEPEETQSEAPTSTEEQAEQTPPAHTPSHPPGAPGARATAQLQPADPASGISGTVTFTQEIGGVRVVAEVAGLKPGKHGFHIHQNGVCEPPFESAGDHLNPFNIEHNCAPANVRHLGDFGNIEAGADGTARYEQVLDKISLVDPHHQVAGKAILIHEGEDDCKTQPSGNSGARIACGVINLEGQAPGHGGQAPGHGQAPSHGGQAPAHEGQTPGHS